MSAVGTAPLMVSMRVSCSESSTRDHIGKLAIRLRVVGETVELRKVEIEVQSWSIVLFMHDIRLERLERQNQM